MDVSIFPNHKSFISGSCDKTIKVWDMRSNNDSCVMNFDNHKKDVNCVEWFGDGYAFGSGSDDASARLYDTRACRELKKYSHLKIRSGVTSLKFSKSGKYLFTGYDDPPYMISWSTLSGNPTQNFALGNGLNQRISCLDINNTGGCIATGSWDCSIKCWA